MVQTSTSPSGNFVAVTPSDSVNFTEGRARALFVGGAGNVVVINENGTAVTFVGIAAGSLLPIATRRVNNTSTTATSIVALY